MSSDKAAKEAFVTGHGGTTAAEILLVCSVAPVGIWLLQQLLPRLSNRNLYVVCEAIFLLLPMAICQTELLYPWGILLLVGEGTAATTLYLLRTSNTKNKKNNTRDETRNHVQQQQRQNLPFITCYRSCVQYLTFVAILAVDFHIFPRRFAKTEVSGYGLMDLGAGSFVVAAGLVTKRQSNTTTTVPQQQSTAWRRLLWRVGPLLLMGGIRLATTKGLEYQEHVSEYGVHWNFFLTLAMLHVLSMVLPTNTPWVPAILMGVYQYFLSFRGLQGWIEDAPRYCVFHHQQTIPPFVGLLCDGIVANREGILGCIGYASLFLAAQHIGHYCVWSVFANNNNNNNNNDDDDDRNGRLCQQRLFLCSAGLTAAWIGIEKLGGIPVSRRTTNVTFCLWTLGHNIFLLACIHTAIKSSAQSKKTETAIVNTTPPILEAVNKHGFLVFVIANLLTGLVNLTIDTLQASNGEALLILFVYLCAVGGVALLLQYGFGLLKKKKKQKNTTKLS